MGLPIKHFIAATNINDVIPEYLKTSVYEPRPSVQTIANAMDVGDPSNFARILDLYNDSHNAITKDISGESYSDRTISATIAEVYSRLGYLLDPHSAIAYTALKRALRGTNDQGYFIGTAHPAKFKDSVEQIIGEEIAIPERLQAFLKGEKKSIELSIEYPAFREQLLMG